MRNRTSIQNHLLQQRRRKNKIATVLYDYSTDSHLYLFNVDDKEGYCTMMCEPINEELPYCELSLPLLDDLDMYYGNYSIVKNDPNLGEDYRKVKLALKQKEAELLARNIRPQSSKNSI